MSEKTITRINAVDGDLKRIVGDQKNPWYGYDPVELRLRVAELLIKACSGCRNSYTEELLLSWVGLMKKDRTPNWKGRQFILEMFYASSNYRPIAYEAMENTERLAPRRRYDAHETYS